MKLKDYQDKASRMIGAKKAPYKMFKWMEDAARGHWEWPGEKPSWMHVMRSTDLQDALKSGSQILSTVDPRIKFQPLSSDQNVRAIANRIENNIEWHLKNCSRRQKSNIVSRITYSSLLYGKVAVRLVFISHQEKLLKSMGMDTKHLERAERFGPFAVVIRNPSHVYETFSDYGLEEVLEVKSWSPIEFKRFWGEEHFKGIIQGSKEDDVKNIVTYDYTNHSDGCIWGRAYDGTVDHSEVDGNYEIFNGEHGLDWIPWIIKGVGQDFIGNDELDYIPLLYSVYKSGLHDTQNITMTLLVSEMISYANQPRVLKESYDPDSIQVDHDEPGGSVDIRPGERFENLQPHSVDGGLSEVLDRVKAATGKTTVSQMLQNPDIKSDVPYSAMNLIFQLGANTLQPFKEMAQDAIAEIGIQMLYWVKHTKKPLVAFNTDRTDPLYGTEYTINPEDFDIDGIYIEVELTADVPTDRLSRINGAIMMNQNLNYPVIKALESTGEANPETAIELWRQEQIDNAELQIDIQNRMMEAQILQQQKMQQMQMMAQQMQMQQQAPQRGPAPLGRDPMAQGFNPAAGGSPPIQGGAPIREEATGQTRGGQEVAGFGV